jgi:hypothetical protein
MMTCLQVTPNLTWPDVVYYHSYTTPYMGWKIHILDTYRHKPSFGTSPPSPANPLLILLLLLSPLLVAS